jgi:hypothetical protein
MSFGPTARRIFGGLALLAAGIVIGGYLFSDTRPRSFIALDHCDRCLSPVELAGLLASVGIQRTPSLLPGIVMETNETVVIRHPNPQGRIHYVIIPKHDIKDLADLSQEDKLFIADAYAVAGEIIRKEKLTKYRFFTNGPDYQSVRYLHFHLIGE